MNIKVVTATMEFFTSLLHSQSAFVIFAFLTFGLQGLAIWILIVSHSNKAIAQRRKELGMNEVDQALDNIFTILNNNFLDMAKEKFGDDYFNKKETALYRYLLKFALEELVPHYRVRIRRNHFNEKSSSEWSAYVKSCITDDMNTITKYLDVHHHPQARISRPEIYASNTNKFPDMIQILEHLYDNLLHIAENNKLKKILGHAIDIGGSEQ